MKPWQTIHYRAVAAMVAMALAWGTAGPVLAGPDLSGPRLRTNQDVFDFGVVPQNSQIAHAFWLKNVGTETAVIAKVKTNCGCTQAPMADTVVEAGDSTWVEMILGTRNIKGSLEKHARIFANAHGRIPAFTILARIAPDDEIRTPVSPQPLTAYIDPDNPPERNGSRWEYPITLRNTSGETVRVRAVDIPEPYVTLPQTEFALAPGQEQEMILRIDPAIMDQPYSKSVTLEMTDPDRSRLTIPVGKRPEE